MEKGTETPVADDPTLPPRGGARPGKDERVHQGKRWQFRGAKTSESSVGQRARAIANAETLGHAVLVSMQLPPPREWRLQYSTLAQFYASERGKMMEKAMMSTSFKDWDAFQLWVGALPPRSGERNVYELIVTDFTTP